jgi:TolA-binding protein
MRESTVLGGIKMFSKIRHGKKAGSVPPDEVPEPEAEKKPGPDVVIIKGEEGGSFRPLKDARERVVSAEQADQAIISTEQLMALPIEDLSFADGKIDTHRAQDWLDKAGSLLAVSRDVFTRGSYSQAAAYAEAARTIAEMADMVMAQALGIDKLPAHTRSAGNEQNAEGRGRWLPIKEMPSREQVRRELLQTYDEIVRRDSLPAFAESRIYLTEAMTAYKVAYDAYVDGSYQAASDENRLSRGMLHVADSIIKAITPAP